MIDRACGLVLLAAAAAACANSPGSASDAGPTGFPGSSTRDASSPPRPFGDASSSSSDAALPPPLPPDAAPPDRARDGGEDADAAVACEAITDRSPVRLYLSADDSSSVASPVIARRMIREGRRVPLELVRTYEFLNYYNTRYEPAAAGEVRVVPHMRATADDAAGIEFQVGVQSETRAAAAIRPMTVTFVLDTSGSMAGDRIERERAVVRAIAGSLRAGDLVSAVTWDTARREVMAGHRVTGPSDPAVLALASGLAASGGTDLEGGLAAGYALARRHYAADRLNRVVVVSDGEANVGVTSAELIARESHRAEQEEIYLVGVGVGDGFNDTMMDTITDRGRGAYVFVDSDEEAGRMFGPRFAELMDIAVRSVRLDVTLPWYMRVEQFHGEQISTEARDVDPQHLAPNDAMVFHQVLRACAASAIDPADPVRVSATYETRDGRMPRETTVTSTLGTLLGPPGAQLVRASAVVAWAEALKEVDKSLREGDAARGTRALARAAEALAAARAAADDEDLREIAALLEAYRALTGLR